MGKIKKILLSFATLTALLLLVLYMTYPKPDIELKPFVDLKGVNDSELIVMDVKKADNEGVTVSKNRPTYYKGGKKGVLLIHGLAASPYEMSFLAEYLHRKGLSVYNVRLAGHGSKSENMAAFTYKDWYDSVRYGYFLLKNNCDQVYVIGQSNGGLVAAAVAQNNPVDGLILISPAVKIPGLSINFIGIGKEVIKEVPRKKELKDEIKPYYYDKFHSQGITHMVKLQQYVLDNLDKTSMPLLVFQNDKDRVVSYEGAEKLYEKANTNKKLYVRYGTDDFPPIHVLTLPNNPKIDETFGKIYDFVSGGTDVEK